VVHEASRAGLRALAIVPALNERLSVGHVVADIRRHVPGMDVLVVDDGSSDGTGDVAGAAGAAVLTLPYNLGVGGAMRAGFKYALRAGYDVSVQVDADGQHDPATIPALLAMIDDADIVVGARFAGVGEYAVRGPRRLAMRLLAWILSRALSTTLTDATSGFRACNRRAMLLFARHYPVEYLGDTVEALLIASRAGMRVVQVPVVMRPRMHGTPTQGQLRATLYLTRAAMGLGLAYLRRWPHDESALLAERPGVGAA
jgi:glycosyltransferase involved in cell wall biosynthesis